MTGSSFPLRWPKCGVAQPLLNGCIVSQARNVKREPCVSPGVSGQRL
uniref:Uncharacterized protein n=1 Tax=Anguilla anguilla TaxID=7936 RepID=A0A0E9QB08_ANGAN